MANIVIHHTAHYEWEPAPDDYKAKPGELMKASADGKKLRRVMIEDDRHTEISMPEIQIKTLADGYERRGIAKSRAKIIAWLLEEKIMPNHAHTDHFTKITVEGEPEVEKFLAAYFELDTAEESAS